MNGSKCYDLTTTNVPREIGLHRAGDPLIDPTFRRHVGRVTTEADRQAQTERLRPGASRPAHFRRFAAALALVALSLSPASALRVKPRAQAAPVLVQKCPPNLCNGSNVISHPQPPGKSVLSFRVLGDRVLYVSNSNCKRELYSVAVTGGEVVQLSDLPADCFRNVTEEFSFSPDGKFAIWEADRDVDQAYEIFSAPILGGPVVQLNGLLPFDNDVERHLTTCDSQTVVYRQGKDSANRWELYAAPLRGWQSGRRISQPMGMSQAVGAFWLTCDGLAWYMADTSQSGYYDLWRVGVSGVPSPAAVDLIFLDGFEVGSAARWTVAP